MNHFPCFNHAIHGARPKRFGGAVRVDSQPRKRGHYMSGMGQYKGRFWGMNIHSQAILDLILYENQSQKMHLS